MPKRPTAKTDFLAYDVLYEDGARTSNRRIEASQIESHDVEGSAKAALEAQDRKVAENGGVHRGKIKSISKSKAR